MKLSKHQKEIVKKIVSEDVYDIPSYLKVFGRWEVATYDISSAKQKFYADEQNKQYKVMKEGFSLYIKTYSEINALGNPMIIPNIFPRLADDIKENEWEYQPAVLNERIPSQIVTHDSQTFEYDFQKDNVFIAKSFEDIKTFITLWSYLRREYLVLETDKILEKDDISVYFELVPATQKEKKKITLVRVESNDENDSNFKLKRVTKFDHDFHSEPPMALISTYLDYEWKINEDHKLTCKEFIGKKIVPNTDLIMYVTNKYRTKDERSQRHSLIVAWIAVAIALVAVLMSSILPLFDTRNTYLFSELLALVERIYNLLLGQTS